MKITMIQRLLSRVLMLTLAVAIGFAARAQYHPELQNPNHPIHTQPIKDTGVEGTLVQLALSNSQGDIANRTITIAQYKVKETRVSWFDLLALTYQYNPNFGGHANTNTSYLYPQYFIGITIPIGTLISKGGQIKAAKEEVKVAIDQREEQWKTLRTEVLTQYREYKTESTLLVAEQNVLDDIQAAFLQIQKRFRDGNISIETYSEASRNYNVELTKELNLQLQCDIYKLNIERIIGVKFESVVH